MNRLFLYTIFIVVVHWCQNLESPHNTSPEAAKINDGIVGSTAEHLPKSVAY